MGASVEHKFGDVNEVGEYECEIGNVWVEYYEGRLVSEGRVVHRDSVRVREWMRCVHCGRLGYES